MIKITTHISHPMTCSACTKLKSGKSKKINVVELYDDTICLCDNCLQELNRKIVEHLVEKNL